MKYIFSYFTLLPCLPLFFPLFSFSKCLFEKSSLLKSNWKMLDGRNFFIFHFFLKKKSGSKGDNQAKKKKNMTEDRKTLLIVCPKSILKYNIHFSLFTLKKLLLTTKLLNTLCPSQHKTPTTTNLPPRQQQQVPKSYILAFALTTENVTLAESASTRLSL